MKIGIITLSASYNCGSMLQSYALKEEMKKFGDVEIINFSSKKSHKKYDFIPHNLLKRAMMKLKHSDIIRDLEIEIKAYEEFKKRYLEINGKEFFYNDLSEIADKYDVIVAGSDQVWNVCMEDFDEAFFCGWTKKKKIAYAPSLGGHDIRESDESEKIVSCLNKFDKISVREEMGKKCLEDILGYDVLKVLDPTLIYDADRWHEMAAYPKIDREYIFYYSWAYGEGELKDIVKKRSMETGMPVYVLDAHKWRKQRCEDYGFYLYREAGPMAFLSLMANAKECFVESFHGMIFAYIFKRNFWLLDTHELYENLDARLTELVSLLGAEERIVTKYNKQMIDFDIPFCYKDNNLLKYNIEGSKRFLKEAIVE